jgi:hypothetical protein
MVSARAPQGLRLAIHEVLTDLKKHLEALKGERDRIQPIAPDS